MHRERDSARKKNERGLRASPAVWRGREKKGKKKHIFNYHFELFFLKSQSLVIENTEFIRE